MNGIEKLTGRILDEAQAEVNRITSEAEKKADEFLKSKKAEAQAVYDDRIKKGTMAAEQRVERLTSVANLEAKKLILATKQEMVSQAFDLALDMLTKLPEDKYVSLLSNLAVEASGTGTEEIIFSQNDKQKFGQKVVDSANLTLSKLGKKAQLKLSNETANIKGGVIAKNGNIEVNCSFETIIRLKHDELATEVSGVLFK